jgi:hypothetical protein
MNGVERFWPKVRKADGDGCWEWHASVGRSGYGTFTCKGVTWGSHRFSWAAANGQIPPGMSVLHRCDNKLCVRPDHLFLGTQADNMADKMAKGRQQRGLGHGSHTMPERRPRGERHGQAILDAPRVRGLRALKSVGFTCAELARMYGISPSLTWQVVGRVIWRHV